MKAEGKVGQLQALLAEKDENLKSVATELERTQKILRFLNNGTSKLDHIITTGESFGDHSSVGYKGVVRRLFLLNMVYLLILLMFLIISLL